MTPSVDAQKESMPVQKQAMGSSIDERQTESRSKAGFRFKNKADRRFKPQAYNEHAEDSKRLSNVDVGQEDIFEMVSK